MKRLGFFGGCFNPPTIAHVELIKKAIEEYNLEKVYFVPMGNLYAKKDLIDENYRVEMLEIALKNYDNMFISRIQIDAKKNLYAIDTFKMIEENFRDSENFFIMGSDNFEKIKSWKSSNELLRNFKYIILDRKNAISSSIVREKIAKNENIDEYVFKDVQEYIFNKKLYK